MKEKNVKNKDGPKLIKRIGSGIMAALCAVSMIGTELTGLISKPIVADAATTVTLASPDQIIKQAATLLGTPYSFGAKGYSGIYDGKGIYGNSGSYSPNITALSNSAIRNNGIDCSGLIYWTFMHLGYSSKGFNFQNRLPLDTIQWYFNTSGNGFQKANQTYSITRTTSDGSITKKLAFEKYNLPSKNDTSATKTYEYWEKADGSTIKPGSLVIGSNAKSTTLSGRGGGNDHMWIYIGEFKNREAVINYLKEIGVSESFLKTYDSNIYSTGKGTHWRIESTSSYKDKNGNYRTGVTINNGSSGKSGSAMSFFAFKLGEEPDFSITINKTDTQTGTNKGVSGSVQAKGPVGSVFGIYTNGNTTAKTVSGTNIGSITIGSDGKGVLKSSKLKENTTYYIKETKAAPGYRLNTNVYTVKTSSQDVSKSIGNTPQQGNVYLKKTFATKSDAEAISLLKSSLYFRIKRTDSATVNGTQVQNKYLTMRARYNNYPKLYSTLPDYYRYVYEFRHKKDDYYPAYTGTYQTNASNGATLKGNYSTTGNSSYPIGFFEILGLDPGTYRIEETIPSTGNATLAKAGFYYTKSGTNIPDSTQQNSNEKKYYTNNSGEWVINYWDITIKDGSTVGVNKVTMKNNTTTLPDTFDDELEKTWYDINGNQLHSNNDDDANPEGYIPSSTFDEYRNSVYFRAFIIENGTKRYISSTGATGTKGSGTYKVINDQDYFKESSWTTNTGSAYKFYLGNSKSDYVDKIYIDGVPTYRKTSSGKEAMKFSIVTNHGTGYNAYTGTSSAARHLYFEEVTGSSDGYRFINSIDSSNDANAFIFGNKQRNNERNITIKLVKKGNDNEKISGAKYTFVYNPTRYTIPANNINQIINSDKIIAEDVSTDKNGEINLVLSPRDLNFNTTGNMPYGFFCFETYAPKDYIIDTEPHMININAAAPMQYSNPGKSTVYSGEVEVTDEKHYGQLNIEKVDSLGNPIPNVKFKLERLVVTGTTNNTPIWNYTTIGTLTTNNEGKAQLNDIELTSTPLTGNPYGAIIRITENSVDSPYVMDPTSQIAYIIADEDTDRTLKYIRADKTFINDIQQVQIKVHKIDDSNNPLAGAVFTVTADENYDLNGHRIVTAGDSFEITTGEDGYASNIGQEPIYEVDPNTNEVVISGYKQVTYPVYVNCKYTISEKTAPQGYERTNKTQTFKASFDETVEIGDYVPLDKDINNETLEFINTPVSVPITVEKVDSKNQSHKLSGAAFALYADEELTAYFTDSNGVTTYKTYAAGELIENSYPLNSDGTVKTNAKITTIADTDEYQITDITGKFTFKHSIPRGKKVYIVERHAPDNFELDTTPIRITTPDTSATLSYVRTVPNDETKHAKVQVLKQYKDLDGNEKTTPIKDAEFALYANDTVEINGTTYNKDSVIESRVFSDANGIANFAKELPVGHSYYVLETNAPDNFVKSNEKKEFTVSETDEVVSGGSYILKKVEFYNTPKTGTIRAIKQNDGTEAKPLAGAVFSLKADEDIKLVDGSIWTYGGKEIKAGVEITQKTTNNSGIAEFPDVPVGYSYTLTEVAAPEYYTNKSTNTKSFDFVDNGTNTVVYEEIFKNKYQEGQIVVYKKAIIDGQESQVLLSGAEFSLYATEDVIDPDKPSTILYHADPNMENPIAVLTTGADGKVTFGVNERLPVGYTYKVKETASPDNYVNRGEVKTITLEYHAELEYVTTEESIYDPYQNAEITVIKRKANRDGTFTEIPLAGAQFDLYAAETIYKPDGTTVLYRDGQKIGNTATTALTTDASTGKQVAKAVFSTKVPVGYQYRLVEVKAPDGYVRDLQANDQQFIIIGEPNSPLEYIEIEQIRYNKPITASFSKKSAVDSSEVIGAELEIQDSTGAVAKNADGVELKWTSDGSDYVVEGIKPGNYKMVETFAPKGFVISTSINFNVDENGVVTSSDVTVQSKNGIPLIVMIDDVNVVKVVKKDTNTNNPIGGAKLQIRDKATNTVVVPEWTNPAEGKVISGVLVVGKTYILEETEAPKGYLKSNPVEFTVKETSEVQTVEMKDPPIPLQISKRKLVDNSELEGASLEIHNSSDAIATDIYGNQLKWVSDGTDHLIKGIPAGNYSLVETASPDGFVIQTTIPFSIDANGKVTSSTPNVVSMKNDIPLIVMLDDYTHVKVIKKDISTKEPIEGAKLQIRDKETNEIVVPEWINPKEGKLIDGVLVAGKTYILEELTPPPGYVTARSVEFTVRNTPDVQTVEMEDDYTKVEISKTDFTTGEEIEGATLVVKNSSGKEIARWTTTMNGGTTKVVLDRLPVGNYTLTEITAPDGYLVAETVSFTVTETAEIQKVEMKDKQNSFKILKLDADTHEPVIGAVLALYDKNGTEIARWTTDGTAKEFKKMPEGEYTLKELKAPKGYNTGKDMKITVDKTTDEITFEYFNHKGIEMPQTGGRGTVGLIAIGTILLLAGAGYFVSRKRKSKD